MIFEALKFRCFFGGVLDGTLDAQGSKRVPQKMALKKNLGAFWRLLAQKGSKGSPGWIFIDFGCPKGIKSRVFLRAETNKLACFLCILCDKILKFIVTGLGGNSLRW